MDVIAIKNIMMICSLADCTEEVAREAYSKTQDVLLAVDSILFPDMELPKLLKRKREDITPDEEYLAEVRQTMKNFDVETENRIRYELPPTSNLSVCEEQDETPDPLEEMVLQNNCLQICQIPSMEEEDQILETECPSHPECSCDSR